MKRFFLATAFCGILFFAAAEVRAQMYEPYNSYWDPQYQQYLHYQNYLQWQQHLTYLRHFDPYYELHVVHYRLYLAPYDPYQSYLPCCYVSGFNTFSAPNPWVPYGARNLIPYGVIR